MNARRGRVMGLYLKGWRQSAIAEQIGVNKATLSRDLDAIRQEWREERVDDFTDKLTLELTRIGHLETEYWASWESSTGARTARAATTA